MKRVCIQKIFIIISLFISNYGTFANNHTIKFNHEISVENNRSLEMEVPRYSVSEHILPAPYNNVTFIIIAPVKVGVGQRFTIDYAIKSSKFTHISYWSDLIPDITQGLPVHIIDVKNPTIGNFIANDDSLIKRGGRGRWDFPKGLPGQTVQQLSVTLEATAVGLLKFTTVAATNPPFYVTSDVLVSNEPPRANPIHVTGLSDETLEFSIFDYVVADSEIKVTSLSHASYGKVILNDDHTVAYRPQKGFYGHDSFTYTIADAAGNVINGLVTINIEHKPLPQIIK